MEDPAVSTILEKYMALEALMDERTKRIWAATEALALGRGGVARMLRAMGYSLQANRKTAAGAGVPAPRRSGDVGGHEEEGAGGRLPQRRGANGGRGASRSGCASTTSRTRRWARPFPTGCATCRRTPAARRVRAAGVGGDQQPAGPGIGRPSHVPPPAPQRLDGERRRVVVHPTLTQPAVEGGTAAVRRRDGAEGVGVPKS